jgi:hypothetical protein
MSARTGLIAKGAIISGPPTLTKSRGWIVSSWRVSGNEVPLTAARGAFSSGVTRTD